MSSELHRRDLLGRFGAAAVAGLTATGTAGARKGGTAPSDRVETEEVSIFRPREDPVEVSTGSWLKHRFGWVDAYGESSVEDLERFIDAVDISASIDGEPVKNPNQRWDEFYQNDEDQWIVEWAYVTEPKSPGVYDFSVTFSFPDGYYDEDEDGNEEEIRPPGAVNEYTGYYEVVPGGR